MAHLLYATADGRLRTNRSFRAVARRGWEILDLSGLIPLPDGASLMHLPGRRPLGRAASGEVVEVEEDGATAVAAVLPPGYLRTLLPAYRESSPAQVLPLYGYAAVASVDGKPHVAGLLTDQWDAWDPGAMERRSITSAIRRGRRALPESRLLRHLETCAIEYRCLTAQNLFLNRGEGAIPVSPACNAACLGCISEQWGDVDSPQTRLAFAPTAAEIAEVAGWHLAASESLPRMPGRVEEGATNFISFGQGCEGEPLTRGAALVEATRRIRAAFPAATIHINTNGSRPQTVRRLVDAGLNSIRISIFSLEDAAFRAYYRPVGYGLEEIAQTADAVAAAGGQVTINLLTFPGVTDVPDEIDRLVDFVERHGVHQVQLRSLNVDPHWLLERLSRRAGGIGMREFVTALETRCPYLRLGNFTRPWPLVERSAVGASF
ncbi:MAG TPA: radical SAM protein [Candidatus Dormibacteraeota bacterium]